ncbi:hypothetical protein AURDEDRAFT_186635 [Auricularia subglabra TFB-10046 SS5]|nr:hypothetical protein AURDEDRAFT_186635 [Auricularia subglabra TFB-10046 SS5]
MPEIKTEDAPLKLEPQLRALTALKWPYAEDDEKMFEDPLTRNDPKQLRTAHYENLATSPRLREILSEPRLRTLLVRLDALNERDRAHALETLLTDEPDATGFEPEDARVFRVFAKEVEESNRRVDAAARRERLGLDWDDDEAGERP